MKAIPALLIVAVATIALAGDSSIKQNRPPLPTGAAVGRFQLVSATIDDVSTKTQPRKCLFRVDTATGQVWTYQRMRMAVEISGHPEGGTTDIEGWVMTDEDFDQTVDKTRAVQRTFPQSNDAKPNSEQKR